MVLRTTMRTLMGEICFVMTYDNRAVILVEIQYDKSLSPILLQGNKRQRLGREYQPIRRKEGRGRSKCSSLHEELGESLAPLAHPSSKKQSVNNMHVIRINTRFND